MKEIAIERVDVIQSGKPINDGGQLFIEVLLGIPNFPHIELANAFDSITLVDNSWCLPLSAGQDYVDEVLPRRDNSDLLEIILHHLADMKFGYLFLQYKQTSGQQMQKKQQEQMHKLVKQNGEKKERNNT
jgi:hypothetical protein